MSEASGVTKGMSLQLPKVQRGHLEVTWSFSNGAYWSVWLLHTQEPGAQDADNIEKKEKDKKMVGGQIEKEK